MNYMSGAGKKVNETLKEQFIAAMQNALPRNKLFAGYLNDDELRNIQSPVLLLVGDEEPQYDPEKAISRARQVVRNIEAHIIPIAGHGLPMEQPEKVNSLMLSFLNARNVTVKQVI